MRSPVGTCLMGLLIIFGITEFAIIFLSTHSSPPPPQQQQQNPVLPLGKQTNKLTTQSGGGSCLKQLVSFLRESAFWLLIQPRDDTSLIFVLSRNCAQSCA